MEELQSIAEEATQIGIEEAAKVIYKASKTEIDNVRRTALDLVQTAKNIVGEKAILAPTEGDLDTPTKVFNFTKSMLASKEENYKEIMTKVIKFTRAANQVLGQKINLIFVYTDTSNNPTVFSIEELEGDEYILPLGKSSKVHGATFSGKIQFSKTVLKKIIESKGEKSYNNIKLAEEFQEEKPVLKATYSNAYTRFQDSKEAIKNLKKGRVRKKWYKKSVGYVYWDSGSDRGAVRLQSAGSLGEAYIAFYLNRLNKAELFSKDNESNIKEFMTDEDYGVINADATSGFLQGDVNEYQVKMLGASIGGFSNILKYAQIILNENDPAMYLNNLQQTLRKEGEKHKLSVKLKDELTNDFFKDIVSNIPQKKN